MGLTESFRASGFVAPGVAWTPYEYPMSAVVDNPTATEPKNAGYIAYDTVEHRRAFADAHNA
jgi:hypothetical protein